MKQLETVGWLYTHVQSGYQELSTDEDYAHPDNIADGYWNKQELYIVREFADEQTDFAIKNANERDALRAELEALKRAISEAEPAAWMRDDGEPGSISTMTNCCSAKVKNLWIKVNPIQIERYTIPLYTLKGIK